MFIVKTMQSKTGKGKYTVLVFRTISQKDVFISFDKTLIMTILNITPSDFDELKIGEIEI